MIGKCQLRNYCRYEQPNESQNRLQLWRSKVKKICYDKYHGYIRKEDGRTEDGRGYDLLRNKLNSFFNHFKFARKTIVEEPKLDTNVTNESEINPSNNVTDSVTIPTSSNTPMKLKTIVEEIAAHTIPRKLLPYPVNPLEEMLASYLLSIQPFFKPKEFYKEQRQTMDFLRTEGDELQKLLENAGQHEVNWLTSRWTNSSYLSQRSPVTVFSSPCIAFPLQTFRSVHDFLRFTSQAIYAICEFKNLVERDQVPLHTWDSYELDNSQLYNIFGTVRIPSQPSDLLKQTISNYVIVIYNNNFYKLDVFSGEGELRNVNELYLELQHILQFGSAKGVEIGLLTHDTRDNWEKAHRALCSRSGNRHVVKCIEKALFTVSLDQPGPMPKKSHHRSAQAAQLLHGGGLLENSANRWMDKTLQLIVNPNGMAGFCFECSPADPQAGTLIMDYVQKNIGNPEYGNDGFPMPPIYEPPCRLCFSQIDVTLNGCLATARKNIHKICARLQLHVFKFPCFGKYLIRTHGLPPDSFIQMALQLAFYRLHQELPAQCELTHLRIFKCGRTEAIRTTSNQSAAFVATMTDNSSSLASRVTCLRVAVFYHQVQAELANQGCGVDRHMFGLKQMALEAGIPLPKFFYSKGYIRSQQFRIHSAQLATTNDAFMAIGPHTSDGYGCSYNSREHDIIFAISSWNHKSKICSRRYGQAIEKALVDMAQLMLEEAQGRLAAQQFSN